MELIDKLDMEDRFRKDRRNFIQFIAGAGLGISCLLGKRIDATEISESEFKVLDANSRIDGGGRGKEIIETAYDIGYSYEKEYKGCARCTVAALQKSIAFIPDDNGLYRAASCLNGGSTPTKESNCGSFTGSGMVIGWICGAEELGGKVDPSKLLLRKVYEQFKNEYGSVLCKDVRKKMESDCPEVVGRAVRWTAEVLLKQFTNYK